MSETYSFPHPVLGLSIGESQDISGEISLIINVSRISESRNIRFEISSFNINNDYFKNLFNVGKAGFLLKVYCSATLKTWVFVNSYEYIEIPEDELCSKVEIEPKIIALEYIGDFTDDTFSDEFNGQMFAVNKYEVIGLLDKIIIPIDKEYESLGLGNIFQFVPEESHLKPCSFDFTGDKIVIKYPPTAEFEHPPTALFNTAPYVAYNIFIVPALTEAFRIMADDDKKADVEGFEWFYALNKLLPRSEWSEDPFINAQLILNREIPVLKAFNELCVKN
ncbi:hypothetical protein [Flavihumibacter fluvii]|uniref:hypothetical protein n=1 Tax=Flavihumibacter fluvii TaxID=2838157 RepID=UPI001BDE42E8|nr:hypothetical protein [Flavihumibacter fluvii]ULQ50972.1 hypothetical protein KJS93_12845 [Flavihumibacter fluvii]